MREQNREAGNVVIQFNRGAKATPPRAAGGRPAGGTGTESLTFFETYADARGAGRIPEGTFFAAGGVVAGGFIPTVLSLYGGNVPLYTFLAIALVGLIWGLTWFDLTPGRPRPFLDTKQPAPTAPTGESDDGEQEFDQAA